MTKRQLDKNTMITKSDSRFAVSARKSMKFCFWFCKSFNAFGEKFAPLGAIRATATPQKSAFDVGATTNGTTGEMQIPLWL